MTDPYGAPDPLDERDQGGDGNDERWRDEPDAMERWWESDVPPAWFDPTYAGERWDDDY